MRTATTIILAINRFCGKLIAFVGELVNTILPEVAGLVLLSIVIGAVLAVIYGRLINEEKVKAIKKKIFAYIHEAVLYKHDPVLTIKAQGALLWTGVRYLSSSFLPIAILCIPSLFLFAALQNFYGYDSVAKDSELSVTVAKDATPYDFSLNPENGSQISPPLRVPASKELVYRIEKGDAASLASIKDASKTDLTPLFRPRTPEVITSSWIDALVYGATETAPLGVKSIHLSKPFKDFSIFGASFPWYIWSIVFILAGGFGAAKVFKITF